MFSPELVNSKVISITVNPIRIEIAVGRSSVSVNPAGGQNYSACGVDAYERIRGKGVRLYSSYFVENSQKGKTGVLFSIPVS